MHNAMYINFITSESNKRFSAPGCESFDFIYKLFKYFIYTNLSNSNISTVGKIPLTHSFQIHPLSTP